MKSGVFLAGGLLLLAAPRAHALINFELDSNDLTFAAPGSGSMTYMVNGSIDLTNGWKATSASVNNPFDAGLADSLGVAFDSSFLAWFGGSQSTNYSGAIFDVTVNSTSPVGLYFLGNGSASGLAEASVTGTDSTNQFNFTDTEIYQVHVTAAPEPAGVLGLAGLTAVVLLRRRKR